MDAFMKKKLYAYKNGQQIPPNDKFMPGSDLVVAGHYCSLHGIYNKAHINFESTVF